MYKFGKMQNLSKDNNKTPPSIEVLTLANKRISNGKDSISPFRNSDYNSSVCFQSFNSQWSPDKSQSDRKYPEKEQIFKDMKAIFQTCRGQRKKLSTDSRLNMSREEQQALYLPQDLRQFCKQHKLREKKPQIQYASTLKRIKQKGKQLGCNVRAKSQGIQLQMIKEKQQKIKDKLNHTFGKDFNRFFKKKLVKEAKKCKQDTIQLNLTVDTHCQSMLDSLIINQRDQKYKKFDTKRLQIYMNAKATQNKKYPLYVKTQIDAKIAQLKKKKLNKQMALQSDSPTFSEKGQSPFMSKRASTSENQSTPNTDRASSTKKRTLSPSKCKYYQEDIVQFLEICRFFLKIQHEILRYLPNNHLSKKINNIISQVQHSEIIAKIYKKCNIGIDYFDPIRIVEILQKNQGLLGNMNYIASMIKLNISAQRRKRFKDTEANILMYQSLIKEANGQVCHKLKYMSDPELKKSIWKSLEASKLNTLATNKAYTDFVKDNQQAAETPNLNIICEILKYQTMLK